MNRNQKQSGVARFFSTTLWELEPEAYRGIRRHALKYLQITALVVKDFWDDQCLLHASALAFSTLLSLVPFFALTFALIKGLGVHTMLEPLILEQVAAGSQEIVTNIITYINNTNMASLGAIGLVALIVTVVTLLANVEESFNVIWGVMETRSIYRKFSDYLSVLVSAPLLLVAATSVTSSLESQTLVQWLVRTSYFGDLLLVVFSLIPYLSIWAALVFLYIFIPNTPVRFKSALVGGVLAGTLWQIAQWGYIHFQFGVARYNAIYGTLATLPVFMIWIYTSWLIVLLGLEVVYAHQNIRTFRREVRRPVISHSLQELLTLAILQEVAESFYHDRPSLSAEGMAEDLDVPVRVVRELTNRLVETGYLAATAGDTPVYLPARELEHIAIHDVLHSLRNFGNGYHLTRVTRGEELLQQILARVEAGAAAALDGLTLRDLVAVAPLHEPTPGNDQGSDDVRPRR